MTTVDEELQRILVPPGGRAVTSVGARLPEDRVSPLLQLSSAFHSNPDLIYEMASLGAQGLDDTLTSLTESISDLLNVLDYLGSNPVNPTDPALLADVRALSEMMEGANPESLASSPLYQQWLNKTEGLLKGALSPQITSESVVVSPAESRKQGLAALALLGEVVAELEARAQVLSTCGLAFETAPVSDVLRANVLKEVRRGVAISEEKLKKTGVLDGSEAARLVASRAALSHVASRPLPEEVYSLSGTISAVHASDDYPGVSPTITALAGPYEIPDPVQVTVSHGGDSEKIQLGPTGYPTLFSTRNEDYDWTESVVTGNAGPFELTEESELQAFLQASDGTRYDATVLIAAGIYTGEELVSELNSKWAALGLDTYLEASGDLQITPTSCSVAFGTGGVNGVLGITSGGIAITESGPGSLLSVDGPFDLSGDPTLLFSVVHVGVAVLVETPLTGLGGTATATQVADAINARLTALGVDAWFYAFTSGAKLDLRVNPSTDTLTIFPCSALAPLGLTMGDSVSGYAEVRTLQLHMAGTVSVVLDAGTYSAATLAGLLGDALGSDYRVGASGPPGSRTVSIAFIGDGWSINPFYALDSGMAAYLGFPSFEIPTTDTSAAALAANIQKQSRLMRATAVQQDPLAGTAETVAGRTTLRFFQKEGFASALAGDVNELVLLAVSWDLQVGDSLVLVTGVNEDTLWTVTSVQGDTLRASGALTPVSDSNVRWLAGETLGDRTGQELWVTSGDIQGNYRVASTRNALELELEVPPTQAGAGSASLGPTYLQLTGTKPSDLQLSGSTKLTFLPNTVLSGSLFVLGRAMVEWLQLPDYSEVVAGDTLEKYAGSALQSSYEVLEVDNGGKLVRTALHVAPTFTASYSTQTLVSRYQLRSARQARLAQGQEALTSWLAQDRSSLVTRAKADALQALQRKHPTPGQVSRAALSLAEVLEACQGLTAGTALLRVTKVGPRMDALLDLLYDAGCTAHEDALRRADCATLFSKDLLSSPYRSAADELRALMAEVTRSMEEEVEPEQLDYLDGEEDFDLPDAANRAEVFQEDG